jgi:NAD(P)H-dependent flavin oxidoreductase YrpB (nitropropane dioxygenase family)
MSPLMIDNLCARVPIIQGGMGVGVSLSRLAGAVAKEGAVGVISTAQIGFLEDDYEKNPLEANLRAIRKHIDKAREIAEGGILGVNIMVATKNYAKYVMAAIEAGIDIIISGAGLPLELQSLQKVPIQNLYPSFLL